MGSIVIYLMILLMQTLLILEYTIAEGKVGCLSKCLSALCRCKSCVCCRKGIKKNYQGLVNWQGYINKMIRFFLETFIELFICSSISLAFAEEIPEEKRSLFDSISVWITNLLLVEICFFLVIVVWFSLFKARAITKEAKRKRRDRYEQIIGDVQIDIELKSSQHVLSRQITRSLLKDPFKSTEDLKMTTEDRVQLKKVKR